MVVPSQTCIRCRSRRMKCDLRLPKCGSCLNAGVECLTVDPGLDENVPRSYIYSLQQRVEELEQQIRINRERHETIHYAILQEDNEASSEEYDYIGLGTSVSLFDQLCGLPLLFPAGSSSATPSSPQFLSDSGVNHMSRSFSLPIPPACSDQLLTSAVQKNLLECFFERVSSELPPILSRKQEEMFLRDVNPLLTYSIGPKPWLRNILLSVYAISSRVMSIDYSAEYAYLEQVCLSELNRTLSVSPSGFSVYDQHALDQITVLCLCIVYELVGPGRSRVSRDVLNAAQMLLSTAPAIATSDQNELELVSQLAFFLSQVEALICLHFKRPSAQYHPLRRLSNHEPTWLDTSMELLQEYQYGFGNSIEAKINPIISKWNELNGFPHSPAQMKESTLLLNLNQHPLFSGNLSWLSTNEAINSCPCSIELLNRVAQAARSYLQYIAAKQQSKRPVICIWMVLEYVLQAGFSWAIYIVYTIKVSTRNGSRNYVTHDMNGSSLLEPLTCCNAILVSLTEKLKAAIPYYTAWNLIHTRIVDAFLRYSILKDNYE